MRTPASIAGHPIHPMLVPIAIGGFVLSFIFDIICVVTGQTTPWSTVAYYTMIGGIVGALCAALPGLVDLLSLPAGHTKKIGLMHMGINLTVVALYLFNAWTRSGTPDHKGSIMMSGITIVMLMVSGWLGGKMVFEAGVGVDTSTSPEAPTARPIRERHV